MPKILPYAALTAAIALASPVLAQTPSSGAATQGAAQAAPPTSGTPPSAAPESTEPTPPTAATGTGANTAANAGASTEVMSGMSVKDSTGAVIGEVSAVKNGVATIKMGSDTFTVDTNKLGVQGGAATINATQADIKKMLPKK
jgi:hypothetical protein